METLKTEQGEMQIHQVIESLTYISYATNRDYGMSHEALVRIGLGNDVFKSAYEGGAK